VMRKFLWSYCQDHAELVAIELIRKCKAGDGLGASLDSLKMGCRDRIFTRARERL
jgi:hypothetical protein